MNRQQLILGFGGLFLLLSLLFLGKTVQKKEPLATQPGSGSNIPGFNIDTSLQKARQQLTIEQAKYVTKLENSISRGDVKDQQILAYTRLANFWQDSVHAHEAYVFYISKAAMLVSSEKRLSFAARQILEEFRNEPDAPKRVWKAEQAISLYEKAIELNPGNDSLKVELASCYVFGKGMAGDAQETMKGIQQLLQVVKKDSANMQAQLVLGIGGVISRQYEKAIDRLQTVIKKEPENIEAISWLADAFAGKGDKPNAMKWYEISKRMVNNPSYSKEVDERIKMLK